MKNLFNLMAYAAIICLGVCLSMTLVSCSEGYTDYETNNVSPEDTIPTKKDDPKTDPEVPDTTKWSWNGLLKSNLSFDTTTEVVSAHNICQITRSDGYCKLDSIPLVYTLGVDVQAPSYIRLTEKSDTTVLGTAKSDPSPTYGDYVATKKDSVCSVSTGHTLYASHYNITATTTSKRGYSLHAGHWEPFKYVTEKAQWASIWNEYKGEVEFNDSIFARYNVHNYITFVITSNKGNKWYIHREKDVVVDHFLRMKQSEPDQPEEPEHNHPDWWGEPVKIIDNGTFVYKPGVGPSNQGLFYKNVNILFENVLVCVVTKSYVKEDLNPIDFDWDNALVYKIGSTLRGKTITSKNVTDLNSVIWRDGKWEPALCTYDQKNYSWTYMSPDGHDQGMTEHLAETCGLKNFAGKHTARLHPSLFYTASLSNGTLVIKDDNGGTIKSFH